MINKKQTEIKRLNKLLKKLGIKKIKPSNLYAQKNKVVYY